MGVQDIIATLHDFLERWLTDEDFRDRYDGDVEKALKHCGFDDVDPKDLIDALPLVAEDLPLVYQKSVYDYMETVSNVDTGSKFDVDQGGGRGHYSNGGSSGDSEVARHIYNIQHITETNKSYIDDRDVVTTITNSGDGDVNFDQTNVGDGAVVAGGDVSGVNTGENSGFIAGDDIEDVEVTNVKGNGNTVTGDIGGAATIVSGDDNVLANDSNVIDGDFKGNFVGDDANGANFGTKYDIDADDSAVNFGSGKASVDNSVDIDDSYNTDNSVDLDVDLDDSFNTDNSDNSDHSTNTVSDSFNDNSTDVDVDVDDSFNDNSTTDNSTDVDVKVDDSFNTDHSIDVEDSFTSDDDTYTKVDADVEVKDSFNEDNDGIDADFDDIEVGH